MSTFEKLTEEELEARIAEEHNHVLDRIECILELGYRGLDTEKALTRIQAIIDEDRER